MIELLFLVLAVPTGFLISWYAKDELKQGRNYFRILMIASLLGIIGFWLYDLKAGAFTFGFVFIVSLISFMKGYDKRWINRKL